MIALTRECFRTCGITNVGWIYLATSDFKYCKRTLVLDTGPYRLLTAYLLIIERTATALALSRKSTFLRGFLVRP